MDTEYQFTFRIERKKSEYEGEPGYPDLDWNAEAEKLRGTAVEWAGELLGPKGKNAEGEWIFFTPARFFPGDEPQPDVTDNDIDVQATQIAALVRLQRVMAE